MALRALALVALMAGLQPRGTGTTSTSTPIPLWSSASSVYTSGTSRTNPLQASNPRAWAIAATAQPNFTWDGHSGTLRAWLSLGTWNAANSATLWSTESLLYFDLTDSNGVQRRLISPSVFPGSLSRAQHRAMATYSNGAIAIFVDGSKVAEDVGPYPFSQPATLYIDSSNTGTIPALGTKVFSVTVYGGISGARGTDPTTTVAAPATEFAGVQTAQPFQGAPDALTLTSSRDLLVIGTSIDEGAFANIPPADMVISGLTYAGYIRAQAGVRYRVKDGAISGSVLATHVANYNALKGSYTLTAAGKGAVLWGGPVNDIIISDRTSAAIIADLTSMLDTAITSDGNRVVLATITGFKSSSFYTSGRNTTRLAVNAWITGTAPGLYPTLIVSDVATAMKDGGDSDKLAAAYDCGDGLHPNTAGTKKYFDTALNALALPW